MKTKVKKNAPKKPVVKAKAKIKKPKEVIVRWAVVHPKTLNRTAPPNGLFVRNEKEARKYVIGATFFTEVVRVTIERF